MRTASNLDALVAQTAASLREMVGRIDKIISACVPQLDALEQAYVKGTQRAPAGSSTALHKLEDGRLLLEIAREARNRLVGAVSELDDATAPK